MPDRVSRISKGPCAGPPSEPGELKFLLLSARTPAVAEITGPDGVKTAHYMLRWLSTRGEGDPSSETAGAAIGAQKMSAFSRVGGYGDLTTESTPQV